MKEFTGKVSRDGKTIAEEVLGQIDERQTESTTRWSGSFRAPLSALLEFYRAAPLRLDLDNGFAVAIDLMEGSFRIDGGWVSVEFVSNGAPLPGQFR